MISQPVFLARSLVVDVADWLQGAGGGENGRLGASGVDAYCCGGRGAEQGMVMRMDRREEIRDEEW